MSLSKSPPLGPQNDLTVPLNDTRVSESEMPATMLTSRTSAQSGQSARVRKNTAGSEELNEKVSKLQIDVNGAKRGYKQQRFSSDFRVNAEMALRVACGVILASFIQTRNPNVDKEKDKSWLFFPEWYYLGGLSYCAVAVIFSAQKTVGATTREVCQAFYGVGMALIYNIILFAVIDMEMYDPNENPELDGYLNITKTFGTNPYKINVHNFYSVLPWIMAFTVVILLLPIETNTKKFALGNNLYFSLTIINPNTPPTFDTLKLAGTSRYETPNVLKNLQLYFLVGFIGTMISFCVMFIPYPVFAINRLREETRRASADIQDLLNIIVDSYCFKNKNLEHMNFLRLKLHRKFDKLLARHAKMTALIEDVWWEQLMGFHILLKFNRSMIKNYVRLVGSLASDLRTLNNAMQLEKYEDLHFQYMKTLQREIYLIQLRSGDLLNEISQNVHDCVPRLDLKSIAPLEVQMEHTLQRYRTTQNRILRTQKVSHKDVEGNVPLNLFLFSLNSMCSTLIDFQNQHNNKVYDTSRRAVSFIQTTIVSFFDPAKYNRLLLVSAFKASIAIFAGTMLAVYVYGFSHTTPNAVAFVMGNHIGGSFSVTVNRVGGVVAGSVVPSVFQFFFSQICSPDNLQVILSDITLFIWVAVSMFVRFSGGFASYAGLVSAFISAGVLLRQNTGVCGANGTASALAISSYSNMAQTSVGILLFIIVELALCPESAARLLRENIQQTLWQLNKAFDVLIGHHLASSDEMDETTLEELRVILQVKVPALLAEQAKLIVEANNEPTLWKQPFSVTKYEAVLDSCYRLLNNNNVLFKLVKWFNYRVKSKKLDLTHSADIRNAEGASDRALLNSESSFNRWAAASNKFQVSVGETFDTLHLLFGDGFLYADQEQTALFMQMKEAFRLADKDCSGEIDASEVEVMLEAIFAQSGGMKESEIHDYVEQFMEIVDHDKSGKVSFEEFTNALDNGLKLEVEVYTRRKPKAPVLVQAARANGLAAINEEDGSDDRSSVTSNSRGPVFTPKPQRNSKSSASAHTPRATESGKLAPITPKMALTKRTSSIQQPMSPSMRRQHDVLNVADFSLGDIAAEMKSAYVQWLLEGNRYEKVTMEELLLLNCLVSGAEGIARHLTTIEEIVVSH